MLRRTRTKAAVKLYWSRPEPNVMLEKEASVKEERAFSRYFWTYWIDNLDISGKLGGL